MGMRMPAVRGTAPAGDGQPLLSSWSRELRKRGQNRITVSKGVKQRGHGHWKSCVPSGVCQDLLSREEVGTPSSCTGQTQHDKLSGDI